MKRQESVVIRARCSKELKARVKEAAGLAQRSEGDLVRLALEEYLVAHANSIESAVTPEMKKTLERLLKVVEKGERKRTEQSVHGSERLSQ